MNKYITDMEAAVKKGAQDAYDDAMERFDQKKTELTDWINKEKDDLEAKIKKKLLIR